MVVSVSAEPRMNVGRCPAKSCAKTIRVRRFAIVAASAACFLTTMTAGDLHGAQLRQSVVEPDTTTTQRVEVRQVDTGVRATSIVKWGALAVSLGTTTYGITRQRTADALYASIETDCEDNPTRCGERYTEGEFVDPVLASRYASALGIDRRARVALIVSQVAVLSSVALFLLDLDDRPAPALEPYDPPLRLEVGASGVGVAVRIALPTPGTSDE